MKKTTIIFIMGFLCLNLSYAEKADLFTYNSERLNLEFQTVAELENLVSANEGITLGELLAENNILLTKVHLCNNSSGFNGSQETDKPTLGLPSFIWGCTLGSMGILLVHLIEGDRAETKKALNGCYVRVGAAVIFYSLSLALRFSYY